MDLDIDLDYTPTRSTAASPSPSPPPRPDHPRIAKHRRPYTTDPKLTPLERDKQKKHRRNRRHRELTTRSPTEAARVQKTVKAVTKRKLAAATPLTTTYIPAAFVWTGPKTVWDRSTYGLEDMQRLGFTIVHWNGMYVC